MNTETNKVIAEFMGKRYDYLICDNCGKEDPELNTLETRSRITKCCNDYTKGIGKTLAPHGTSSKDLKYHTSWDWLIPCCKKCSESMIGEVSQESFKLHKLNLKIKEAVTTYDIVNTYTAILQFIHYFNERKK